MADLRQLVMGAAAIAIAIFVVLPTSVVSQSKAATTYTNHTVGGAAGWFFDINKNSSATNYTAWAANQTFALGDYLIFKTNDNSTVVQTANETTYSLCDDSTDDGTDTFVYVGNGEVNASAEVIAVPLILEGMNYYFSNTDDGSQCMQGMKFQIKVAHGNGLPPSLSQPPPPPPVVNAPPPAQAAGTVTGSSNQGETFYKGGAVRGGGVDRSRVLGVFFGVCLAVLAIV